MSRRRWIGIRPGLLILVALNLTPALGHAQTDRVSEGPLRLTAPAQLILGDDQEAVITLSGGNPDEVQLLVNVGTLSAVETSTPGTLRAVYTTPRQTFPQIAILAAIGPGGVHDWLAIPMLRRARLSFQTEPNTTVTARAGPNEFGPVQVGADGKATLSVLVPPGITRAVTMARDPAGNTTTSSVDLNVPPFDRFLAVCPEVSDVVRAYLLTPDGAPATGLVTATSTVPATVRAAGPGAYDIKLDTRQVGPGEPLEVTVRAGSLSTSCTTRAPGALPNAMQIETTSPTHVAGEADPVVAVILSYPDGDPSYRRVPQVTFEADPGEFVITEPATTGGLRGHWKLPAKRTPGEGKLVVRAGMLEEVTRVALHSARVARLELALDSADQVVVSAFDRFDNPVPDLDVTGTARGVLGPFAARGPGQYVAAYHPPLLAGSDTVVARVGDTAAELSIESKRRATLAAAVRVGYLTNLAKVSAPIAMIEAQATLPFLDRRMRGGVEVSILGSSREVRDQLGEEIRGSTFGVPVALRAHYVVPIEPVQFYGGLSAGVAIVRARYSSPSIGERIEWDVAPLGAVSLGAQYPLAAGSLLGELSYGYASIDSAIASGNVLGLQLSAGYRFSF